MFSIFFFSTFLIGIILLQMPKQNRGLSGLGSSSSGQLILKIITAISIVFYLLMAIRFNLLYMVTH